MWVPNARHMHTFNLFSINDGPYKEGPPHPARQDGPVNQQVLAQVSLVLDILEQDITAVTRECIQTKQNN